MTLIRRYRTFSLASATHDNLLRSARAVLGDGIAGVEAEFCFYIDAARELAPDDLRILDWLLAETFEPGHYGETTFLDGARGAVLEVGPRMTFTTAWSTNAVSICGACGIDAVQQDRAFAPLPPAHDEAPIGRGAHSICGRPPRPHDRVPLPAPTRRTSTPASAPNR